MKKNIVLVARDKAPSDAFGLLEKELKSRGHNVVAHLGFGKPLVSILDEIRQSVRSGDVVVIGMSSSKELAESEIAASEEALVGMIPFGYYGDTYHCHKRAAVGAWFETFRHLAKFFFAINEEEAHDAKNVFTSADCVATGNPTWEGFAFPKHTREEVRAKYGVKDDEILILAPGGKSPAVNLPIWGLLVEALSWISRNKNYRILVSYHPGDRTPYAVDPDIVYKLVKEEISKSGKSELNVEDVQSFISAALGNPKANLKIYGDLKIFSGVPVEFLDASVRTSDVLSGADIVVEWGSSLAIEAAHQRIPVVSISTELGRKRMFSISKTEEWEACNLGVALEVSFAHNDLRETIFDLVENFEGERTKLLKRQEEVYPTPQEKGSAVKKMADVLLAQ